MPASDETSPVDVLSLVRRRSAETPHALALSDGEIQLNFRELLARAMSVAGGLNSAQVPVGSVVAIYGVRSAQFVVAQLGIWIHGSISLAMDASQPEARNALVFADAGPSAILATIKPDASSELGKLKVKWLDLEVVSRRDVKGAVREEPASGPAYLIYTSGSTGKPKGVLVGHSSFAAFLSWQTHKYDVTSTDRASSVASVTFDAFLSEVWPHLVSGASVHFAPDDVRMSPWEISDWFVQSDISIAFLPTGLAELYVRHGSRFDQLRLLIAGGDRLRLPDGHRLARFVNHYGPAEATIVTTAGDVPQTGGYASSIGKPISSARVLVLSDGRAATEGEDGELLVGGPCLALGYYGAPDATAAAFGPLEGQSGIWYRTGDIVRWKGGELWFVGRRDRQRKVRGVRVEPGEIEAVIHKMAGIDTVIVEFDGDDLVAAVVTTEGGHEVSLDELRKYALANLPSAMVPRRFIVLDALPLTPYGKVDHSRLRELVAKPN